MRIEENPPRSAVFATTRWTLVLKAGRSDETEARVALEKLCRTYWYPVYCCVRRFGYDAEDARDLTQGFFYKLLRNSSFGQADPRRGRFRTFLLRSLERFLHNEHRDACAEKRGGGEIEFRDMSEAEIRYALEMDNGLSPARLFEKQWAATLVYTVLERLRSEFAGSGKPALFDELEPHLWSDATSTPYAELSSRLRMTPTSLRVTVHRLKRRFHELVRAEIAETVESDEELEAELAFLGRALQQA